MTTRFQLTIGLSLALNDTCGSKETSLVQA